MLWKILSYASCVASAGKLISTRTVSPKAGDEASPAVTAPNPVDGVFFADGADLGGFVTFFSPDVLAFDVPRGLGVEVSPCPDDAASVRKVFAWRPPTAAA